MGNYLNTKRGEILNNESQHVKYKGLFGRINFKRVSSEFIEFQELLNKPDIGNILCELQGELDAHTRIV